MVSLAGTKLGFQEWLQPLRRRVFSPTNPQGGPLNQSDNSDRGRRRIGRRGTGSAGPSTRALGEADRRPYPSAPSPTKPSLARPGAAPSRRSVNAPTSAAPTPATVWACGATPIGPTAVWPLSIVAAIVTSFSAPGSRVALMLWPPATAISTSTDGRCGAGATRGRDVAGAGSDSAFATIEQLGRSAHPLWVRPGPGGGAQRPPRRGPSEPRPGGEAPDVAGTASLDLISASVAPDRVCDGAGQVGVGGLDEAAMLAARSLRCGGIYVVLTHCDWSGGELLDPGGPIVTSGQSADLLYLQHVVALHRPAHAGQFVLDPAGPLAGHDAAAPGRAVQPLDGDPSGGRDLPVGGHRRIHSDIYVFAQPHDWAASSCLPDTPPQEHPVSEVGVLG